MLEWQDWNDAEALVSTFTSSPVQGDHVDGYCAALQKTQALLLKAKPTLKEARSINLEQIMAIALRLKPAEREKARALLRDVVCLLTKEMDSTNSDQMQPVLYQAAMKLLA